MSIETMGMWPRCSTSLGLVMSIVTRRIRKVEECKIAVWCAGLPMLSALGRSKSPEKAPRGGRKSWGGLDVEGTRNTLGWIQFEVRTD